MGEDVRLIWGSEALGRLFGAVVADDVDAAAQALADGADPNVAGLAMLHRVAADGSAAMAELLLTHGADRDRADPDGWTALTTADAWDNEAVAEVLEAAGADSAQRRLHGFTELHRAVRRCDHAAIARALASVDVNAADASGDTALTEAIERRDVDAVEQLLAAGADPNGRNNAWSPLTASVVADTVEGRHSDLTRRLLRAGADPNPAGVPPIVKTVNQQGRRDELIDVLLDAGADINATDPRTGSTLLHEAAALYDDPALVSRLLDAGARIDARDHRDRTPLQLAAGAHHGQVTVALLAAGATFEHVAFDYFEYFAAARRGEPPEDQDAWEAVHELLDEPTVVVPLLRDLLVAADGIDEDALFAAGPLTDVIHREDPGVDALLRDALVGNDRLRDAMSYTQIDRDELAGRFGWSPEPR